MININVFNSGNVIHGCAEGYENEESVKTQLTIQEEMYNFFGTKSEAEVKKYFMFVPKGSIYFHGDNINQGEIMYTTIQISEKIISFDSTGNEIYKYKINDVKISYDSPVIKIKTRDTNSNDEIENTVTQTQALLSKASALRLKSNQRNENKKIIEEIATVTQPKDQEIWTVKNPANKAVLDTYTKIKDLTQFAYDFSAYGLKNKNKNNIDVFDTEWASLRENERMYKFVPKPGTPPQYLTQALLKSKKDELKALLESVKSHPNYINFAKFAANLKQICETNSKPEDEILKPPSKTQFFGNPCAETNIALAKGSSTTQEVKTNAKYLYSMQVYMVQNDIYLLDYSKLRHIFSDNPQDFRKCLAIKASSTGLDKRSLFWGDYFKGLDEGEEKEGFFTNPFKIAPNITLTEYHTYSDKKYDDLVNYYEKVNRNYLFSLRNSQPKEDTPVITHLNYILNLRGFNMSVQGFTDFDPAETYIIPPSSKIHPRIKSFYTNKEVICGEGSGGIICRELTIYNSPKNLIFMCYSSTLPNYCNARTKPLYDRYFSPGENIYDNGFLNANNEASDANGDMFANFSESNLFNPNIKYNKTSINIFQNFFRFGKIAAGKKSIKVIKKKFTNSNGLGVRKDVPQFNDLQQMLIEENVRENIYNTILYKLSKIKTQDGDFLTICDSNLFLDADNPNNNNPNVFQGFKLIIAKKTTRMIDLSTKNNDWYTSNAVLFRNLTYIELSNFVNNINAGKITNYESSSPFLGYKSFFISDAIVKSQKLVEQHDINDYKHTHLDGAIFNLIKYNNSCPNNWLQKKSKMTKQEINTCNNIAKKISLTQNDLINKITGIPPNDCQGESDCLKRINKLTEIFNPDEVREQGLKDSQSDDIDDDDI